MLLFYRFQIFLPGTPYRFQIFLPGTPAVSPPVLGYTLNVKAVKICQFVCLSVLFPCYQNYVKNASNCYKTGVNFKNFLGPLTPLGGGLQRPPNPPAVTTRSARPTCSAHTTRFARPTCSARTTRFARFETQSCNENGPN